MSRSPILISFVIGRKTIKKRMLRTLEAIKVELRKRMHDPIVKTGAWVWQMLNGYLNYFAVPDNDKNLWWFFVVTICVLTATAPVWVSRGHIDVIVAAHAIPVKRRVLRTPAAANYVGLAESKLEKKRLDGTGPRFIRLGTRAVGYDIEDLDAYINAGRRASTSDDGTNLGLTAAAPASQEPPNPPLVATLTSQPRPSSRRRGKRAKRVTQPMATP
jgi:predicted DNA-binding transcriptional regulator AlpA